MKRWVHATKDTSSIYTCAFCKIGDMGPDCDPDIIYLDTDFNGKIGVILNCHEAEAVQAFDSKKKFVVWFPVSVLKNGVVITRTDYLVPTEVVELLENQMGLANQCSALAQEGTVALNMLENNINESGDYARITKLWSPKAVVGSRNGYQLGRMVVDPRKLWELIYPQTEASSYLRGLGMELVGSDRSDLVSIRPIQGRKR